MEDELLIRYLARQCSVEEVDQIGRWITADKANAAYFFEMEHIWNLKQEAIYADEQQLEIEYKQLITKIESNKFLPKKKNSDFSLWVSYAAAIVLFGL